MKTIGLIGGMSWESTELYYRWINQGIKFRLGGLHSARIVLVSMDFQEIETLQSRGEWEKAGKAMVEAAEQVQSGGADYHGPAGPGSRRSYRRLYRDRHPGTAETYEGTAFRYYRHPQRSCRGTCH